MLLWLVLLEQIQIYEFQFRVTILACVILILHISAPYGFGKNLLKVKNSTSNLKLVMYLSIFQFHIALRLGQLSNVDLDWVFLSEHADLAKKA